MCLHFRALSIFLFLNNNIMQSSLEENRLRTIRNAIINYGYHDSVSIKYRAPWFNSHSMHDCSVDLIYSQAVLEHVNDLLGTYKSMYKWLAPNGFMSHQIDFKCHGTAQNWNGHWSYNDFLWTLIKGKRLYLLNREPCSTHIRLQANVGFKVVDVKKVFGDNRNQSIKRTDLSKRFASLSDEDFITSSAHLVSVRQ